MIKIYEQDGAVQFYIYQILLQYELLTNVSVLIYTNNSNFEMHMYWKKKHIPNDW